MVHQTIVSRHKLSTVDAYQGQDSEFVVINLVVVHVHTCKKPGAADDNDESDEVDGLELASTPGRVTSHVKSTNRLCRALTRGRSSVVFFGQLSVVLGKVKDKQRKATADISEMAKDFLQREVVYHDNTYLESSPQGQCLREK